MHKEPYDLVMCIARKHIHIARTTLKFIIKYLEPDNIYLITHPKFFNSFQILCEEHTNINLIDENQFSQINYSDLQKHIQKRINNVERTGWYFQQFLKMQASQIIKSNFYLIWDADTIPLKKITFFNKNKQVLVHTSKENHQPYFETLNNVLGINKQVPFSFITEHMMINKKIMEELIRDIQMLSSSTQWPMYILNNINNIDLPKSGFSEYESFGNYIALKHRRTFQIRTQEERLKTYRFGSKIFGINPSKYALKLLKELKYDYVTFEDWDISNLKITKRNNSLSKKAYQLSFIPFYKKLILAKIQKQIKNNL